MSDGLLTRRSGRQSRAKTELYLALRPRCEIWYDSIQRFSSEHAPTLGRALAPLRLIAMAEHGVIEISPEVMHGTPVFAGTRVPVKTLFDYLKGGDTLAEFLDDFPTVSQQQAVKALELAGEDLIDAAVAGRVIAKEAQSASRTS